MHQREIAHRYELTISMIWINSNPFDGSDCITNNIMFDPSKIYPNGFRPVKINLNRNFKGTATAYTTTQRPLRYYIDLGLSRQHLSPGALDEPLRGGDKSASGHQLGRCCDLFHTEIYYIGYLVQEFMKAGNRFCCPHR